MTLEEFKDHVKTGRGLDTEEIHRFMDEMSDAARQITFRLNAAYHTPEEVRALLSELFGYEVPPSLRVFPPFYTDFGKNIHRCVSFHHSTRISVRTSLSGRMSLSMPAAIFRIMAALSLATDVR